MRNKKLTFRNCGDIVFKMQKSNSIRIFRIFCVLKKHEWKRQELIITSKQSMGEHFYHQCCWKRCKCSMKEVKNRAHENILVATEYFFELSLNILVYR